MFCIKCGARCPDEDRFCSHCGTPLPEDQTGPRKKGRLWVPFVIILVFMVVGFSAFFMFRTVVDPQMPWYSVKNGNLSFDESSYTGDSHLKVPAVIADTPVTGIDIYCFNNTDSIKSITISNGVETIGECAFYNCASLKEVNIPSSVTKIGTAAFYNCQNLQVVRLTASVTYLDSTIFVGCGNLEAVYFHGTAQQWEETFNGSWPYIAKIYVLNGNSYEKYVPTN